MGGDVAQEVLSKLFQQVVGEDVANIGFDMVNGTSSSLEQLRSLMEQYGDDFTPNLNIEWDDIAESAPAIVAMIAMPLTYSISNGIALAFIAYALIKILTGKFSSTSPAIWVIAILSVISFAVA